jgi:uncharacterized protein (TIGR02246 family)
MIRSPWFRILAISFGLAIFVVACQQQPQQPPAPPDTRAADAAAIRNADAEWSKTATAKDAAQFTSYFAGDALFLPPNQSILKSKEEIQKFAVDFMASPGLAMAWQPTEAVASRGGDLGYTIGTYELTVNGPKGKPVTDRGKYLTVWKKQADGSWKVAVDTFNSDLPAEGTKAK